MLYPKNILFTKERWLNICHAAEIARVDVETPVCMSAWDALP
jgi:hypothetical protein